jgi:uncharacterized protein (DUF1015 family)
MASRQIIIADGHHRYEAALRYSEELGAAGRVLASDAAAGYVLMSLVSMDDPGLLVLPYHRLLDGLSQRELAVLWLACDEVFEVDTVDLPAGDGGAAEVLEKRLGAESPCEVKIAALGPDGGPARLLTTRRDRGPATMGAILEQWDTWVLHNRVVDPALGANSGGARLSFTQDAVEAVRHARTGKDGAAFLMSPARMDLFEQTVKEGVRLPAKSTCFYPKLPAGLVINTLEGDL